MYPSKQQILCPIKKTAALSFLSNPFTAAIRLLRLNLTKNSDEMEEQFRGDETRGNLLSRVPAAGPLPI